MCCGRGWCDGDQRRGQWVLVAGSGQVLRVPVGSGPTLPFVQTAGRLPARAYSLQRPDPPRRELGPRSSELRACHSVRSLRLTNTPRTTTQRPSLIIYSPLYYTSVLYRFWKLIKFDGSGVIRLLYTFIYSTNQCGYPWFSPKPQSAFFYRSVCMCLCCTSLPHVVCVGFTTFCAHVNI